MKYVCFTIRLDRFPPPPPEAVRRMDTNGWIVCATDWRARSQNVSSNKKTSKYPPYVALAVSLAHAHIHFIDCRLVAAAVVDADAIVVVILGLLEPS